MVAEYGSEAWLILEDGVVVGDAGTHGPPDEAGDVEIGYGLAEPSRGRGLSSEFVPALAQTLLARPEVRRVVAREVLASNAPSRRALERAGFRLERESDGLTWYALERSRRESRRLNPRRAIRRSRGGWLFSPRTDGRSTT